MPTEETVLSLSEKLSIGAEVALMGIAIVFLVLILLWGLLELFRVVFYTIPNRKKASAAPAVPAPETEAVPTEEEASADEGELVAAITAAIAAYRGAEGAPASPTGFRVVSFRRK